MKLRANLIAHLGADRCSFVDYGADCKDLNDTLLALRAEAARHVLKTPSRCRSRALHGRRFPERSRADGLADGIEALNDNGDYTRPALSVVPGTLTVSPARQHGQIDGGRQMVAHFLKRGCPSASPRSRRT
jgi:hypothetical protein